MSENFRRYIRKELYPVHSSNIKYKAQAKSFILKTFKKRQWTESDQKNDWDILWAGKELVQTWIQQNQLKPNQKVNHYLNSQELTEENLLLNNLVSYRRDLEVRGNVKEAQAFDFFPQTLILPQDSQLLLEECKNPKSKGSWVIKPVGKVRDLNTFLLHKVMQLSQLVSQGVNNEESPKIGDLIIQEAINNPLQIGGKKILIKLFCLVTSFSSQTAYLYREGLVELTRSQCNEEESRFNLGNLTVSMNSEGNGEKCDMWELRKLKNYLSSRYGREKTEQCFFNIQQTIVKTLKSVQDVIVDSQGCFELYEFDLALDSGLKPWLIRVDNELKASSKESPQQELQLKSDIIDDVLTIIDMEKILTGREEQIGGFDLICGGNRENKKKQPQPVTISPLGSLNTRCDQLKKLSKDSAGRLFEDYQKHVMSGDQATNKENVPLLNLLPSPGSTPPKTPGFSFFKSPKNSSPHNLPHLPTLVRSKTDPPALNEFESAPKVKNIEGFHRVSTFSSMCSQYQGPSLPSSTPTQSSNPLVLPMIRCSTARNVNLPPIVTNSARRVTRKPKSMINIDVTQQAPLVLPQSPISSEELRTPSTGDSVGDTQEPQNTYSFDMQVLKTLHKSLGGEGVGMKMKGIKCVPPKSKRSELHKTIIIRSRIKTSGHLQEIKEEEEMSRSNYAEL